MYARQSKKAEFPRVKKYSTLLLKNVHNFACSLLPFVILTFSACFQWADALRVTNIWAHPHTHRFTASKHLKTWFSSVHGLTPNPVYATQSVCQSVRPSVGQFVSRSITLLEVPESVGKTKNRKQAMLLRQCCISVCSPPTPSSPALRPSSSLVIDVWHCSSHKNLPTVCCLLTTAKCPVDFCLRPAIHRRPFVTAISKFFSHGCVPLSLCVCLFVWRHSAELIYLSNVRKRARSTTSKNKVDLFLFCGRVR